MARSRKASTYVWRHLGDEFPELPCTIHCGTSDLKPTILSNLVVHGHVASFCGYMNNLLVWCHIQHHCFALCALCLPSYATSTRRNAHSYPIIHAQSNSHTVASSSGRCRRKVRCLCEPGTTRRQPLSTSASLMASEKVAVLCHI